MISTVALFWALCVVCIVNMARYFSSLRALLVVRVTAIHCSINMLMEGAFLPHMANPTNRCVSFGISMPNVIAIITMMSLFAAVSGCVGSLF